MATLDRHAVNTPSIRSRSKDKPAWNKTVEQLDDGYYEVDLSGKLTYVNERLASIVGSTRDELVAPGRRHISRYLDAATVSQLTLTFDELLRTRLPNTTPNGSVVNGGMTNVAVLRPSHEPMTGVINRTDGQQRYVELSVGIMTDEHEKPIGFCGIVRDVTQRRRLAEALDHRVKMLAILQQVDVELSHTLDIERVLTTAMAAAMIISAADAGGLGLLEDGRIRVARAAGGYQVGYRPTPGGIAGRVLRTRRSELVSDVTTDPDYQPIIPATQAQITCPLEAHDRLIGVLVVESADAARFTPEVFEIMQLLTTRTASAIDNAQLYGLAQQQLSELRALNTQLRELEQLKSDMIRIASHDLRSPLGIISGYLSLIRDDLADQLTSEHQGYIEAMMHGLDRIDRLTTDFLSLERLQSAKEPPRDEVDIALLVGKAVYDARDTAQRKELTLDADMPSEPLLVIGSETDLYEAIVNLIGNGLKYTPRGGRLHVRLAEENGYAVFIVEDTGIGIPAEYHERLFQSFFRVKTQETRDIPGTGLGLHLVKKIVDRHRGQIIFRSEHGQGSVFGFTVPLFPASGAGE